ncbi:MAG: polyprenyl synthetase family protein [Nitrospiria bacterium]
MDQVWADHKELLSETEEQIQRGLQSKVELVNTVTHHILNSGGKRIRPLLLIISAHLCDYLEKERIFLTSAILEFIHTATLLHDDVIDNAEVRRGISPARVLWGNQASILVGDYLYTLALSHALQMDNFEVNSLLATTCLRMAEGETLQLYHNGDLNLSEDTYLQIIEYKTAMLISASCKLGGMISKSSEERKEALSQFGKNLGMAFQVADDTLDYVADGARLGKSLGEDLKEGKITLPLLHLLQHCTTEEKAFLDGIMTSKNTLATDLQKVITLMKNYGSIDYAINRAQGFANAAKSALSVFSASPHKDALLTIADYVVHRDH